MTRKRTLSYIGTAGFLFLFQLLYHHFGHGIVSISLRFCWLLPLIGGVSWFVITHFFAHSELRFSFNLFNSGLACLVMWSILQGILEIAGSDSPYLVYYLWVGGGFLLISLLSLPFQQKNRSSN